MRWALCKYQESKEGDQKFSVYEGIKFVQKNPNGYKPSVSEHRLEIRRDFLASRAMRL